MWTGLKVIWIYQNFNSRKWPWEVFGFINQQHFNAQCFMDMSYISWITANIRETVIFRDLPICNLDERIITINCTATKIWISEQQPLSLNNNNNKNTKAKANNQIDSDLRTIFFLQQFTFGIKLNEAILIRTLKTYLTLTNEIIIKILNTYSLALAKSSNTLIHMPHHQIIYNPFLRGPWSLNLHTKTH